MNTHVPDNPDDRLDAYLDGALSGDDRRAFEARIAGDVGLGRDAVLQDRIDEALRRTYAAPDVEAILAGAERARHVHARRRWLIRATRIAAAVLLGAAAVLAVTWAINPGGGKQGPVAFQILGLGPAYQKVIDDGFEPDWVCETDQQFARTYGYRLGQPLVLGALPAGVRALGLSYSPAISADTIALLATVDGTHVVVFADHIHTVKHNPPAPPGQGLHVYQRRVGDMMLYEVSPLDTPRLLEAYRLYPGGDVDTDDGL